MKQDPTVGRKVWYRPSKEDCNADYRTRVVNPGTDYGPMKTHGTEPLDATVVAVNRDGTVNLVVFDAVGFYHRRLAVPLVQGDEPIARAGAYCQWMPYQVKQHAKNAETPSV